MHRLQACPSPRQRSEAVYQALLFSVAMTIKGDMRTKSA